MISPNYKVYCTDIFLLMKNDSVVLKDIITNKFFLIYQCKYLAAIAFIVHLHVQKLLDLMHVCRRLFILASYLH